MLLLTLTTDKLQLKTSVAGEIDVTCSWTDRDQSTGVVGLTDKGQITITTAATTDIVAAPGATTTRHAETMFVRNVDATKTNTVTILYNANGVFYELNQVILYPGDVMKYGFDTGFRYLPINGVPKAPMWSVLLTDDGGSESARMGGASSTELTKIPGLGVKGLEVSKRYSFFGVVLSRPSSTATGGSLGGVISSRGGTLTDFLIDQLYVLTSSISAATIVDGSVTAQNSRPLSMTSSDAGIMLSLLTGTFLHSGSYGFSLQAGRETIASTNTYHDINVGSLVQVWEAVG